MACLSLRQLEGGGSFGSNDVDSEAEPGEHAACTRQTAPHHATNRSMVQWTDHGHAIQERREVHYIALFGDEVARGGGRLIDMEHNQHAHLQLQQRHH